MMQGEKILRDLYRAILEDSTKIYTTRWRPTDRLDRLDSSNSSEYNSSRCGKTITLSIEDYKKLISQIEYLHEGEWTSTGYQSNSLHERYIDSVIKEELHEEELREKHPSLKKSWNNYQLLKILIANENSKN